MGDRLSHPTEIAVHSVFTRGGLRNGLTRNQTATLVKQPVPSLTNRTAAFFNSPFVQPLLLFP